MSDQLRQRIFEALGNSGDAFVIAALHPQDPQTNDILLRLDRMEAVLREVAAIVRRNSGAY